MNAPSPLRSWQAEPRIGDTIMTCGLQLQISEDFIG